MRRHNPWICLLVVGLVGTVAILGTGAIAFTSGSGREPSQALVAIVSACIGSLSSFLVALPTGSTGGGDDGVRTN